ncbi:MAG: Gfo/Idh/MocA family oxidoreductase [Gemmataceae bacterium]|nr:Gfo/Idh/MocA family oxidoreductase [Gemmataceae bacterium]
MNKLRVGIIGCGYWGPNLIRNFSSCPRTEVAAVCDASPERLEKVKRTFGSLHTVASVDQLLETPGLQAVAIATPVGTHFPIAKRCLEAGLHVLVEKPLAASTREAQALADIAAKQGRVLMVDHTYLFSNSVRKIKDLIESDALGELFYIDSIRINLGLFQHDVNVIWDLAPHDLAIADYILGHAARSISAWGCAHADPNIEDIAYVNVDYGDRLMASFHVNWLSPVKIRQMIFAGARKSLIFNELNSSEPVKLYDRGIDVASAEEEHRVRIGYRSGDIWSPNIDPGEPLQAAVSHFAECIANDVPCISDGAVGVRVVQLLEAATRSIRAQGGRIALNNGANGAGNGRAHWPNPKNAAVNAMPPAAALAGVS